MGCTASSDSGGETNNNNNNNSNNGDNNNERRHRDSNGRVPEVKPQSMENRWLSSDEAMSVLLAMWKPNELGASFQKAAASVGSSIGCCQLAVGANAAMEMYIGGRHDLVIIDRRCKSPECADGLLRSLRAVSQSEFTTFVAVVRQSEPGADLLDLQQIGYDLKFDEAAHNCQDLLLSCQRSCFRHQQQLACMAAVFSALDRVTEAVEITDDRFRIQYANSAHERMFGSSLPEVAGRYSFEVAQVDRSEEEAEAMAHSLRKGREWEGVLVGRRKSGATTEYHSCVMPVRGRRGRVQQFVSIKQQLQDRLRNMSHRDSAVSRDSSALVSNVKGSSRKSSSDATRTNSMTVEAPIHRLMALISAAQEAGPPAAVAALEKVADILQRAPDLYSGELTAAAEDKMAAGYVDGLMTGGCKLADGKRLSLQHPKRNSVPSWRSLDDIPEDLRPYLDNEDNWSFDIIELERVTNKKPMVYLGMKTLKRFNVCELLRCNEDTLLQWLQAVQSHYRPGNSYHNATHGADVMQCAAYFLDRPRVKAAFDEFDEAASLLGALVHDIDHPGRTNAFLINSRHSLAVLYNDISVLESHHASLAFQLTVTDASINIFAGLTRDEYRQLRRSIIDIVLATEMAKHFEHVTKFSSQILAPLMATRQAEEAGEEADQLQDDGGSDNDGDFVELLQQPECRQLIKRVLIKCADISNQCRPLRLCTEWSSRIAEEYIVQTDEEKRLSLPIVMPVFDRSSCNLAQTQVSFIDFFLRDLLAAWHSFCDVPLLVENMNNNYAYWKQRADTAAPSRDH